MMINLKPESTLERRELKKANCKVCCHHVVLRQSHYISRRKSTVYLEQGSMVCGHKGPRSFTFSVEGALCSAFEEISK